VPTVDSDRLRDLCERSIVAVGYELCDVEYVRDQAGWVLRVFIDHPASTPPEGTRASGISLSDCEAVSRHLGTVLDVEDVIPNAYRLEVSSPGVKRPLRKEQDFARFVGQLVRVQLSEPLEGRKNFFGRLHSAEKGSVGVEVDGRVFQLPLQKVRRARLEIEV
jgi:ribosome maturation factor RimP